MELTNVIHAFWADVAAQKAERLRAYFAPDARINWHASNECFTVEEYLRANCEYPGAWSGAVEQIEATANGAVSVAHVWLPASGTSFHAVSFFAFADEKITALDEYWCDDGPAPQWRTALHIGRPIHEELPV